MTDLTPKQIVAELDKYIIGQNKAKRAVAVALRNRWRRLQLPKNLSEEIYPKNIILIGPTGVGKTEIARRIAKLTQSPFIKVEASKFTEVGYVGRDVESMVRDLMEISVNLVRAEQQQAVSELAMKLAEDRLLDVLLPSPVSRRSGSETPKDDATKDMEERYQRRRAEYLERLRKGAFDDRMIEIDVKEQFGGVFEIFSSSGIEEVGMQMKDMLPGLFTPKVKKRKVTFAEAREVLMDQESSKLIDMDKVIREAKIRMEERGIIFIDELDKIAGREGGHGPDVSREGVQRDLLPIVEGSTVNTKYGMVHTEHILFLAAGAFNVSKPSDLIPELQGRFPVKVDVTPLNREDLRRILIEPENSLTKQYSALLQTEGVSITFHPAAIDQIAEIAEQLNEMSENIGARRLHTVMEILLEELSFHSPDMQGVEIPITKEYVEQRLKVEEILKSEDIRRKRKAGFVIPKEEH